MIVAETLLDFLSQLPDGIIPEKYYIFCTARSESLVVASQALNEIPAVNKAVFLYLMSTLKQLGMISSQHKAELTTNYLVDRFVSFVFKKPTAWRFNPQVAVEFEGSDLKEREFLRWFL